MNGIEKSIRFHRKSFNMFCGFIFALLLASALSFSIGAEYKGLSYILLVMAAFAVAPAYSYYRNARFLEKIAPSTKIDVPEGLILVKK